MFNEKEVRECYKFLNHLNETEIRIIDPKKVLPPKSIFVHSENEFVEVCKQWNTKFNIYAGINERQANGTNKNDVISVKTVVIDIDAPRPNPSQTPATDEELKIAETICDNILKAIEVSGQVLPVKLHSGNGFQLWFAIPKIDIDDMNRQEIEDKLQIFQDMIIKKFDTANCIDKIGDLPRIIKVWGTFNIKGTETNDRPFRISKIIGSSLRVENEFLKKQLLELEKEKNNEYEIESIDDINFEGLPPCVNHLLKFYENKDGKYWYRIIQFLSSFFMSIGLPESKTLKLISDWNKKQSYHEDNEEQEIVLTVKRIYKNKINIPNCKKVKNQKGGFPYFGLADLKICKPDGKCNKCVSPVIRYKRGIDNKTIEEDMFKGILDKKELAIRFKLQHPFFYDKAKLWWFWNKNKYFWEQVDETDLMNAIARFCILNTINSKEKNEMLEALKQVGREGIPEPIKPTWVQFHNVILDIMTGERFEASPKYFVTNPIPYRLHPENYRETPVMDKIFEEWVGKEHIKTLYEILAYSILPDYPIHRLFCFIGAGMNGKSCYLRLMQKFIGLNNVCSTELDTLLTSRFEVTRLHKKLVCMMGETNFDELNRTSLLKKLTGGDLIGFEYKNKNPFEERSYAKIIIATNNLPETTDKTIGFYRRWLIVDFPNTFDEQKDILEEIPEEEYECLALKCCLILKDLLEKRKFNNEGSIDDRMKKYEAKADPISKFIQEELVTDDANSNVGKAEFERRLNEWCKSNRFRQIYEISINKKMKEIGMFDGKVWKDWFDKTTQTAVHRQVRVWFGLKWRYE